MPLTLNVGLTRKVGEANYGSRGASVNVAMEIESSIAQEPDKFRARIREVFHMVRQSVEDELRNGHASQAQESNGAAKSPPATASQVRALHAIAKRQKCNLKEVLRERCGVARPEDLSLPEASRLIDELNGRWKGNGART